MGTARATTALLVAGLLVATGCSGGGDGDGARGTTAGPVSSSTSRPPGPLKAAWLFVGDPAIAGWAASHDAGRRAVERAFGAKVQTTVREYIDETDEAAAAIDDLVRQGNTLVFATAFGLGEVIDAAAKRHPGVHFELVRGRAPHGDVGVYSGAGEQTQYLSGMAAGAATKSGVVGFVAPFPYTELVRHIDAYTLGVRAVNPSATVRVGFVNSWWDPVAERRIADALVAAGADVLAQEGDSPATGEAARDAGVAWTGYDSDQSAVYPGGWLTAPLFDWGPYYTRRVQAALDGTWRADAYYGGVGDGFTTLAPYGDRVTPATRARIDARRAEMAAGTFDVFDGPLVDQAGAVRVRAGERLPFDRRMTLDWFVQGVVGDDATPANVRPEPRSTMGSYRQAG